MTSRLPYPLDHATHLPFLIGLGAQITVRAAFEFGAGPYSTPLFLNVRVFPKLKALVSYEPHQEWRDKVRNIVGPDERLEFIERGDIAAPSGFDLVFVDNGPEKLKIETIEMMAAINVEPAIVVIHDAEHLPYQKAMDGFQTKFISEALNPGTAICTNANMGEKLSTLFYQIDAAVRSNSFVSPDNVALWTEIMNG
jgi:hypothetical protein